MLQLACRGVRSSTAILGNKQDVLEKLTMDCGVLNNGGCANAINDHPALETLDLINFQLQ